MRYLTGLLVLAALAMAVAACSATDPQVPMINGVPVDGQYY
jgi:hypothetical protein